MNDTNTLDTAVNELADESEITPATGYTPVFDNNVRTIVYVAALVASVIGLGFMCFGHPDVGGFISTAARFHLDRGRRAGRWFRRRLQPGPHGRQMILPRRSPQG